MNEEALIFKLQEIRNTAYTIGSYRESFSYIIKEINKIIDNLKGETK
jgi:hypothetical protein